MSPFSRLPLRVRLTAIATVTSLASLLLVAAALLAVNVVNTRSKLVRELTILAEVVGANSTAALAFDAPEDAEIVLSALSAEQSLLSAAIYDSTGERFAQYRRHPTIEIVAAEPTERASHQFTSSQLSLSHPIVHNGGRIGTIVLQSDLSPERQAVRQAAIVMVLAVVLAGSVALLLSTRLQRSVSEPILRLLATTGIVSDEGDYSIRASGEGTDELGRLVYGFNHMLGQVERRDLELKQNRESLEETVKSRTAELVHLNEDLLDAKRKADEANVAKSAFLASMTHELRTPLNGVLGYVQLLQREPSITSEQQEGLNAIRSCGEQLLSLVNDVLDLSKIESGNIEVDLQPTEIRRLLSDVEDVVRERARSKGLSLDLQVSPELPRAIRTDAKKLRQILMNLVGNAIKFTDQGSVALDVEPTDGGELRITVRDSGVGISADELNDIFDAFAQADGGKNAGGTGLGLAISRRLALALGGNIEVESEPGKGSCFTVTIPLLTLPDGAFVPKPQDRLGLRRNPTLAHDQRLVALVADDHDDGRRLLVRTLQRAGFETIEAKDGGEAVRQAVARRPQLIVTDVRMPHISGLEAARRIRATPGLEGTTILAISAGVLPIVADEVQRAGCDDFLAKPFRFDELFRKIEQHMDLVLIERSGIAEVGPSLEPASLPPRLAVDIARKLDEALEVGNVTRLGEIAASASQRAETNWLGKRIERSANAMDFDALHQLAADLRSGSVAGSAPKAPR